MPFMIDIAETTNPILTIAPIILFIFSGYTVGTLISNVFSNRKFKFVSALIFGNVILNFVFISGFIAFGLLSTMINGYFTFFTFLLIALSVLGIYLLSEKLIRSILRGAGLEYLSGKKKAFKISLLFFRYSKQRLPGFNSDPHRK